MASAQSASGPSSVCGRGPRQGRAASARRQAAAAEARRGRRAGSSARAGRRAHPHAGDALARLAGVLGAAGHRQDHGGAAAGAGDRPAFRADFGDLHRRRRSEEGVRGSAPPPRDGAGHAAVRRRDPSLQPRPAGQFPAGDGGRHHRAGRRHHRKPVVRTERAAAVARARAGVQVARCRRQSKSCWRAPRRSRGRPLPLDADARARSGPHGGRRRPRGADACRRSLARGAQGRDFRQRQIAGDRAAARADLRQERRTATTI